MSSRDDGWNRARLWRSVIRRVLDGGDGWESGGILDISIDRDGFEVDRFEWKDGEEGEPGGEDTK